MDVVKTITVILQAILQIACIATAIYMFNKQRNGERHWWLWFGSGAGFQLIRRIMYLLILANVPVPNLKFFTFIIVPTCVSICYFIACLGAVQYVFNRQKVVDENRKTIDELKKIINKKDDSIGKLKELSKEIHKGK